MTVLCVRGVGQRSKLQLMCCVSVKPWLLSDTPIWVPFLGSRSISLGSNLELNKATGLP